MGFIGDKLSRAREALHVLSSHAGDLRSRAVLAGCYAAILRDVNDATPVDLKLKIGGRIFPFHMRRSDLFTVAEILHERQYDLQTPLAEKPVILDGGANVGVAALWFHACYPGAEIHAFEPEPSNFAFLHRNLADLPGTHLHQAALGDSEEPVQLHLAEHSAVHSVVDVSVGDTSIEVPCMRLDKYLEEQGIERVNLLKLDVEGVEDRVIAGLGKRLTDVDVVVGEMHEAFVDADALYARLAEAGIHVLWRKAFAGAAENQVHAFEAARAPA